MSGAGDRRLVLVVGVGRSGTSLLLGDPRPARPAHPPARGQRQRDQPARVRRAALGGRLPHPAAQAAPRDGQRRPARRLGRHRPQRGGARRRPGAATRGCAASWAGTARSSSRTRARRGSCRCGCAARATSGSRPCSSRCCAIRPRRWRARRSPTGPGRRRPAARPRGSTSRSRRSSPRAASAARSSATRTCSATGGARSTASARASTCRSWRRSTRRARRRSTRFVDPGLHRNRVRWEDLDGVPEPPARDGGGRPGAARRAGRPRGRHRGGAGVARHGARGVRRALRARRRRSRSPRSRRPSGAPARARSRRRRRRPCACALTRRVPEAVPQARAPGAAAAARIALLGSPPCRVSASSCRSTTSSATSTSASSRSRRRRSATSRSSMVDDGSTDRSAAIAEALRRARPALQARQPAQRRAEQGAQHRHGRGRRGVPRLRRLRRRARAQRLRAAGRRARRDGLGLRERQRPPAHQPRAPAQARFLSRPFAETRLKTHITKHRDAARRPDGLEQAVAALVLGPARTPLPGGPDLRGHPGRAPAALRRATRSTCSRTSSTTGGRARASSSRSRSAAPSRARSKDRLTAIEEVSDYLSEHGPAPREALVRRERRRRRPEVLPATSSTAPTRTTGRCSWTGSMPSSTASSPRVYRGLPVDRAGSSGTSCAGACCRSCSRCSASSARTCATPRRCGSAAPGTPTTPFGPTAACASRGGCSASTRSSSSRPGLSQRALGGRQAALRGLGVRRRCRRPDPALAARPADRAHARALQERAAARRAACGSGRRPWSGRSRRFGAGGEPTDISWAGFAATLDPRRLRSARRWRDERWDLYITVRVGRVWRSRSVFRVDPARPLRAVEQVAPGGAMIAAAPDRRRRA